LRRREREREREDETARSQLGTDAGLGKRVANAASATLAQLHPRQRPLGRLF
jgi:hypothetical protein